MLTLIGAFVLGLFLGGCVGLIAMAALAAGSDAERMECAFQVEVLEAQCTELLKALQQREARAR